MSQYQLIPYNRIEDHFQDQLDIPVSNGSIGNFNQEAYDRLERFERWTQEQLATSGVVHVDETGINIGGARHWLHSASNDHCTCYMPHHKRGGEAMDAHGDPARIQWHPSTITGNLNSRAIVTRMEV